MKNTLSIIFFLKSSFAFCQTEELYQRDLPLNENGIIELTSVFDAPEKSKNDLYILLKSWIAEKYVSANKVIQVDDKEAGLIIVKGIFQYDDWITYSQHHMLKFQIKDNKFRVTLTNIVLSYVFSGTKVENNIEKTIVDELYKSNGKPNKGSRLHKEKLVQFWDDLNSDLKKETSRSKTDNDW